MVAFYQQGAARSLFFHDSNPGANIYFADRGNIFDREGRRVLVGRFSLMNHSWTEMEVSNHIRAGFFVVEQFISLWHVSLFQLIRFVSSASD